ncbi:MAG: Ig-like domain-containing protein [Gemmatimonas sp.]
MPLQVDPVVVIITPGNAAMNIGESLIFAVQVTGGSATSVPTLNTCTSSNAAVATAAKEGTSSCKVTAIAAGNVTVTAAASSGQVASAAVTVSAQAPAISNLTLSPNQAALAPQQTVTITPNLTKGAAGNTVTYTYATSSTAIATIGAVNATTGAVVVTAVAPGVATITATAVGAGTGFSGASLTASATINVGAFPSGITSLNVQPTSLLMPVGRTQGLTASVVQPAGAPLYTIAYVSSNTAVATVNASGVVTAISAGTANITVTASSASNATFAAGNLVQIVPVNVQPLANVSIQLVNQGPYVTTGLDSTYDSGVWNSPAAGNSPAGPRAGVIAGIRRSLNPQINQPIDVTNTKDQIQVILNLQANGQRVDSVVVYIDPASSGARRAAARQIYTNGDAGNQQTVTIETFILTEDFTTNETTGVGEVHYVNGLKAISASVWTTLASGQACVAGGTPAANNTTPCEIQNAANIRQNVNFNNIDNFALKMSPLCVTSSTTWGCRPGNSQTDAASRTWWGGPTVSTITQNTGLGSFQTYPVIYTAGRSIQHISATFGRCLGFTVAEHASGVEITTIATPNFVTDSVGPWIFTYGDSVPTPALLPPSSKHINCKGKVGAYDQADQYRFEDYPMVVNSLDNSNNPGPRTIYAYNPNNGTENYAGPRFGILGLFRNSPQLVSPDPIRMDYQAPILTLTVTQPNLERWVNDAYLFNSGYTANDFIDAVTPLTGVGVGLFPTASRNTIFRVASANAACGTQTFVDVNSGLGTRTTAKIGDIPQLFSPPVLNRESPCDFTNNAFVAQATETDRLGNRGTIGNLQTTTGGVITLASPLFGIDNTGPDLQLAWDGSGPIADMPNIYRATGDSIFQPVNGATAATPVALAPAANATDFWFGARYTDTRSGFNITNHGTRTVKRFAPNVTPLLTNRAVVTTVASRTMNFLGGTGNPVETEDPIYRRDSLTIYGAGGIATTTGTNPTVPFTANPAVGYYQYNLSITDRAGNTSNLQERAVIDQTSPIVTGTRIPSVFGASLTATAVAQVFLPTGTDDVEAIDSDMFLRYNAMSMVGDSSSGSTVILDGARMRFRRDRFANFHNAWAVFGDTLLATPFGPDAVLSFVGTPPVNGITLPIPSIRGIEPVDSTDAPISYGTGAVNPFIGFKPNKLGVYAFDVRAEHRNLGAPNGWPVPYAASLPFKDLGMTNLFPSLDPTGGEAGYTENLFVGNISNGVRWDAKDLNPAVGGSDRLISWSGFGGTGSNIEFRAVTSTIVTQPPFPMVHLFKWEVDAQHTGSGVGTLATTLNDSASGQWVYVGTLNSSAPSNPQINDQGATRFWRYGFSSSSFPSVTNGMIVQPGVTTGCYRAVGVDLSGDGITTKSYGVGCPVPGVAASTVATVSNATDMTITLRAYGNGQGSLISVAPTSPLPFRLDKSAVNQVERVSQNRPNSGLTITIGALTGFTLDRAPTGCTTLSPAVYPLAGPATVTCTYQLFAPATITAIFETVVAGTP